MNSFSTLYIYTVKSHQIWPPSKKLINSELEWSLGSSLQPFETSEIRDRLFQDSKTVELFFVSKSEQTNFDFIKEIKILELIFKVKEEKQEEKHRITVLQPACPCSLLPFKPT